MAADFVHLSVHSEYALSDSLVRLPALMSKAHELGMGAVGMTDPDNMFAAIRAQKAAHGTGVKPILGVEVSMAMENVVERVTLIATDKASYTRLCEALSAGYTAHQDGSGRPIVMLDDVKGPNIICLAGGRGSPIGRALVDNDETSLPRLRHLAQSFPGSLYLKVARVGHPADNSYVSAAVGAARRLGLPVVAVNDVRFLRREDHATHEIRVKIATKDNGHQSGITPEQYLKSPEEMAALFADIPSAIQNSVEIARRATLDIELGKPKLPRAPVPVGETEDSFIVAEARRGLDQRLESLFPGAVEKHRATYDERLEFELNVIKGMGFPGYFLIVADFIRWAKSRDIPVGPGRGSGAGSLVAYALGITDLDPLAHNLLFERFLNPERVSMPDFDVDFCMDRRDEVIAYVADTYGREAVSQIITFGTMAARLVIRDVARAMGHPYLFGDRLAKLVPGDPGTKLKDAIENQPDLKLAYETDAEAREVLDHALALEGLARQVGKHAGGVLIAPGKLTDLTPLYSEPGGAGLVSQYDKDDVEEAGLVKFDFLGLRTLTILHEAVKTIHARYPDINIDLLALPMQDEKAFQLILKAETAAVFQLESHGMRRLIRDLQPGTFEEIVALVALFRPGPLQAGMVEDYIQRKHGRAEVRYPHPKLASVLSNTYGVFVYQEQVMAAAQVLAGYSLGQADLLRRAMGKKKPEEMAKQRQGFLDGCSKFSDIPPGEAGAIFDLIETFAGYGFNKSHSAGYALLTYQTAYLKSHYPAEFMAAVLSSEMHHTDKVVETLSEVGRMGLAIRLPDVNVSGNRFVVNEKGQIVYGLEAIKGVGGSIVETIVSERTVNGPYTSIYDFCSRTGINKRALESLAKSGALDRFGPHRAAVFAQLEDTLGAARQQRKVSAAQDDMFGLGGDMLPAPNVPEWSLKTRLQAELESFGCFVSGHPMSPYKRELAPVLSGTYREVTERQADGSKAPERNVTLAGYVVTMVVKPGRKGSYAQVRLDDGTAQFEVFVPAKLFMDANKVLLPGATLVIDGKLEQDDYHGGHRVLAREIRTIDQLRERHARRIVIALTREQVETGVEELKQILESAPAGPASVMIQMPGLDGNPTVMPLDMSLVPTQAVIDALEAKFGPVVKIELSLAGAVSSPSAAGSEVAHAALVAPAKVEKTPPRPLEERHKEIEALFRAAEVTMAA